MKALIVTGLSGAGKSSVIKSLEDIGYYCIDNLPPNLMKDFAKLIQHSDEEIHQIAFGIDLRAGKLFDELESGIRRLAKHVDQTEILYLEASDPAILKRYKESRRSHPYSSDGTLTDGIYLEREKLMGIREQADYLIDTSDLNIHQLRERIRKLFDADGADDLSVVLISFGFKKGIPLDVDMLFDLRFLPNPFYIESLREMTGLDEPVRDFVMGSETSREMLDKIEEMVRFLLPHFKKEGKSEIIIGLGCTGGHHRSVTFAVLLEAMLVAEGYDVVTVHRDIR